MLINIKGGSSGAISSKKIIIIIVLMLLIFGVFRLWFNSRAIIEKVSYGELVVSSESSGLVIREEKVFNSSDRGEIELHKSEGERVRYGEKILTITSEQENIPVFAEETGVVSFAVDGLEDTLHPDKIQENDIKELISSESNYTHLVSGHETEENAPLYRIVDNRRIYLLLVISPEWSERLREEEIVFIQPQGTDKQFEASIINKFREREEFYTLVKIESFPDRWLNKREVDITMIKDIHRGILIPRKAVFNTPQGRGVLTLTETENYQFTEITVEAVDDDHVIAAGLEMGDQIVINPQQINYGREE